MNQENELSDKRERFCQEYCIDFNGTQAAIRAGYSPDTANVQASQLLTILNIQNRVDQIKKTQLDTLKVTKERVISELAKIAFGDARNVMTWTPDGVELIPSEDISDDDAAMVAEASQTTSVGGGSIKLKLHDKTKALELLGKHLAMFTDKKLLGSDPSNPFPEIKIEVVDRTTPKEEGK